MLGMWIHICIIAFFYTEDGGEGGGADEKSLRDCILMMHTLPTTPLSTVALQALKLNFNI